MLGGKCLSFPIDHSINCRGPSPICDLILENRRYPHNFQNAFYLFFVFYRDRRMD